MIDSSAREANGYCLTYLTYLRSNFVLVFSEDSVYEEMQSMSSRYLSSVEVVVNLSDKNANRTRQETPHSATVVVVATGQETSTNNNTNTTTTIKSIPSLATVKSGENLNEVVTKRHISGTKEKTAVAVFVFVLFASCVLSIVALYGRSEGWISSESNGSLKIGWRRGCLGEKTQEPSSCSSPASFHDVEDVLSEEASVYGQIAVALLVAAWVLPLTVVLLVNRFQRNGQETCCHGYIISILWSVCGLTLIILGVLFILSSQSAADDTKQPKLDVYCKGFQVCSKVGEVSECPDVTCRRTATGAVHCADHGRCKTRVVRLTCEDDGVVCDLVPDWGLVCLFVSASLMIGLSIALGLGSVFIGKHL